jgi:predicted HTH transcriptional regulator
MGFVALHQAIPWSTPRSGAHVVRNPWLYARLSDAGLVTRAGTGIRRIVRLVREATGREVGIEVRDFEVLLTLPRPASPATSARSRPPLRG